MALTNPNKFSFELTKVERNFLNKRVEHNETVTVDVDCALADDSYVLIAFRYKGDLYVYHDGVNTRSQNAQKIINAAKKIGQGTATAGGFGMGGGLGLMKDKNTGIAGAIAGGIVGFFKDSVVSTIVDFFDGGKEIEQGYYCKGKLVYSGIMTVKIV